MVISNYDAPAEACDTGRVAVVIADECPAMREGLARLMGDECNLAVAGSAATGAELRSVVASRPPQVLVMDLMLQDGDGLALVKDLLELLPGLKIVVFTMEREDIYATRCLQAGVRAFVSKRANVAALFRAIQQVAAGGIVVPSSVTAALFAPAVARTPGPSAGIVGPLTDRELQVFRLSGQGQPTRAVAHQLGVSVKTVESHRENIKNKLALGSHAELVARAAQWLRENQGA